ncbi:MAG: hypothetical protein LUD72_08425 [Bacteroidales bacterium]|nr:hypothetical protein [Bacteroidales bacterium]
MSRQPAPKEIEKSHPNINARRMTTLLVDGNNVLEYSSLGDRTVGSNGMEVGGIKQFLLQLRIMLQKASFDQVYVFWDGDRAGQMRYNLYQGYKLNRGKSFEDEGLSPYMRSINERVNAMMRHFHSKEKPEKVAARKKHKDLFYWQRDILIACLEELFIRQVLCEEVETDDLMAYYVHHRIPNERIVIMSTDRDLTQLIGEKVIQYIHNSKRFINLKNHTKEMGYHQGNVVLMKMICGDNSDNIAGIKNVGEKTLLTNFPELKKRKVELEEVIGWATQLNEERVENKKKPLKWAENIVGSVTDGVQGERIYEINRKIIDLSKPMLTDEARDVLDAMMYSPLDPTDRSMENLYRILSENGVDELRDTNRFSSFFLEFSGLINRERKFLADLT